MVAVRQTDRFRKNLLQTLGISKNYLGHDFRFSGNIAIEFSLGSSEYFKNISDSEFRFFLPEFILK